MSEDQRNDAEAAGKVDAADQPLQFERAEYAAPAASSLTCSVCKNPIQQQYHVLNGNTICETCRFQIEAALAGGSTVSRLGRATLFGLGAAAAGCAIYFAVSKLTGYEFSLIAILIGYMVGRAV